MPVASSPADELAQLKKELEQKQTASSTLAKEVEKLKSQITDLGKTVGEINQNAATFEKAVAAEADQIKDLVAYVKTEKAMLKAALPASAVTDIEKKKADALQALADLKKKLEDATRKAGEAATAHERAKKEAAEAAEAYQKVVKLPADNADVLKDATGLRGAADKQGAAQSFGREYFLVLVLDDRLGTYQALTLDEYKKRLNEAGSKLASASEAVVTAKETLDEAVAAQKQAQKDLDDKKSKWRQETLDSIPAKIPAYPAAGSPPSPGP